ncbi:MAG: anhydro-N-acetylmuramic acid kinase [Pseudopedobacter saltans]|uniref:Anhydro-N-acetylmuramic acid kinase n=1 Tax=Pseudopedobacter saltans TaxID=151895 RepID=A0A2W5H1A0_9SPHI|nr:MAG: anhydro-N-acetylmuramic acid kinase [Pseudopedobacter saltans]
MVYRSIGLMSGSSLDGLDIAMVEFEEVRGVWNYHIEAAETVGYTEEWIKRLQNATQLSSYDYLLLHSDYGHYIGQTVRSFIEKNQLEHRVQMIVSHGHTTFHNPALGLTAQIGDGAAIAAETNINVVSDLRSLDVALGGQGAPIVPMGEKFLWSEYSYFLNLGGIANISIHEKNADQVVAFDICPANRVLNILAQKEGFDFDKDGAIAEKGQINTALLTALNAKEYYKQAPPKSLANEFGAEEIMSLITSFPISNADAMRTFVEHIALQIGYSLSFAKRPEGQAKMLVTGGGAFNLFLMKRIKGILSQYGIEVIIPGAETVAFKEAIVMGFLGILRWREENTVLSSVTGAKRSSIGGAVWIGQEY